TSSPIEALSYHELQKKNNTGTRYIAISDNMSEKQKVLLKAEIKKVPEVEIATANNKHTEQIKSLTGFKEQSKADQHTHFKEFFKDHAKTKDPSKEQAQKHVEKSSASEPVTLNSMLKKQKQRSKSMER
ncbi:MAG: hypothetical protein GY715_18795, partial [Planctomycetes bacterium]|nr:hypothetical protein [Planctomycetota bacterium]